MEDEYKNGTLNTEFYETTPDQDERLSEQKKRMNDICKCLVEEPFSSDKALSLISDYLLTDRFLYSIVSDFIFKLQNDQRPIYLANVELLLLNCPDKSRESILKLYDHANLAVNQLSSLKQSDEEFNSKFGDLFSDKINPKIDDIEKSLRGEAKIQIESESKGIFNQLISIVSIFTAIAFVVFGGISFLENIFVNINKVSLLKLCIVGSIWGLCILNLIALFMYFIFKLVKSNENGFIRNDKVIRTGNILLFCILIISSILYFLTNYADSWFHDWYIRVGGFWTVLAISIISVLIYYIIELLFKGFCKKK